MPEETSWGWLLKEGSYDFRDGQKVFTGRLVAEHFSDTGSSVDCGFVYISKKAIVGASISSDPDWHRAGVWLKRTRNPKLPPLDEYGGFSE